MHEYRTIRYFSASAKHTFGAIEASWQSLLSQITNLIISRGLKPLDWQVRELFLPVGVRQTFLTSSLHRKMEETIQRDAAAQSRNRANVIEKSYQLHTRKETKKKSQLSRKKSNEMRDDEKGRWTWRLTKI